jgi:hypothetical protein
MEPLVIIGSNECPTIIMDKDKNMFEIHGQSLPEEAISFYSPVIDWLEEYAKSPLPETVLHVMLDYCNSSSTKALADLFEVLEEISLSGKKVEIRWQYMEDDDDMLEVGKEFQEIIKAPFTFVAVKPE